MGFIAVSTIFCLCLASSLATYGPDHKSNGFKPIQGGSKGKVEESRIHLDSPKIILHRPSINVHGSDHGDGHGGAYGGSYGGAHGGSYGGVYGRGHGGAYGGGHGGAYGGGHGHILEDEPIILENDKPLYIRKTLHGIPATSGVASAPHLIYNGGYSSGKVLDISAPIQVISHSPVVHERPILIRRPVVVSKGLTSTQDHLERLHYVHSGGYAGHAIGNYAVPISKALHERTVVYGGLGHGLGHGVVSSYGGPYIVEQPKGVIGHSDIGYSSGKALGGAVLHGGAIHGGSLHGVVLHGGSYGGSLHGGSSHGGSYGGSSHGGSYGGSLHGGSSHGGSLHGADLKKY